MRLIGYNATWPLVRLSLLTDGLRLAPSRPVLRTFVPVWEAFYGEIGEVQAVGRIPWFTTGIRIRTTSSAEWVVYWTRKRKKVLGAMVAQGLQANCDPLRFHFINPNKQIIWPSLAVNMGRLHELRAPRQGSRRRAPDTLSRVRRLLLFIILPLACVALLLYGVWNWFGTTPGAGHFPSSLIVVVPSPGRPLNEETAAVLNRSRRRQSAARGLKFVGPTIRSRNYREISVNPIGPHAWGAVALNHHSCYAVLVVDSNPRSQVAGNSKWYYAKLPEGSPCLGRLATPKNVRGTSIPS